MTSRISIKDYETLITKPKRSKYGVAAKRDRTLDGIVFASKGEMKRWCELKALEKAGMIWNLARQVKIALNAEGGELVGHYVADFRYIDGASTVLEDYKGHDTPLSIWKRRHLEAQSGGAVRLTGYSKPMRRAKVKE